MTGLDHSAPRYRREAEEARRVAANATFAETRAAYLKLADHWDAIAKELEAATLHPTDRDFIRPESP
jgi:hypothetical protein